MVTALTPAPDAPALLRGAGLRVTDTRVAVIAALHAQPHSGVDTILAAATHVLPAASRQSVHNALTDLTEAGLARRIEPAGRPGLYELRVGDNHHHVICTNCGAVADVDCVVGHAPCLTPEDGNGYVIAEAEVTFWGLCGNCQGATIAASPDFVPSPKEH